MRRGFGLGTAALAVILAALPAAAQDAPETRYWPLREIIFPVPVEKLLTASPKPAKLRFYVAANRGEWRQVAERAVDNLDSIDAERNRKGFRYTSSGDGEYDFALQLVFADGSVQPRDRELTAQYRVVFDTRPPAVRVAPLGRSGVEWSIDDEHLRPDGGVMVEVRWQGESRWTAIQPRAFKPRDSYQWEGLKPNEPLEVRVIGRDRAGLEMASRIITLPATSAGTGLGAEPAARPGTGIGFGQPDEHRTQPSIDYVNSRNLTISSRLTKVTRSGVRAAHLWVNDGKSGWTFARSVDALTITPATPDPEIKLPHTVTRDGLYGFIVIPENGAGRREPDPLPTDPAQFLIEVDTEKPFVKIKDVRVSAGGARGPRVEIEWEATDKNLWPEPIALEYALDRSFADARSIHPDRPRIENTGRYVWEVEDRNVWKFFVRAKALDKASLQSDHVYEKEVTIDLETPKARIERVQGSGGAPPRDSHRPAGDGPSTTPPPAPPASSLPTPPPVVPVTPPSTPLSTPPGSDGPPPVPKLPSETNPPKK
jgi:hypothetical protein